MDIWQIWGIIGIIFVVIEICTPVLFFLNLAFAALFVGLIVYLLKIDFTAQLVVFSVLAFVFLLFLRPLLLKTKKTPAQSGIEAKYIGKEAKVVNKITKEGGRIAIYGEEWKAKTRNDEEISESEIVKIISNDGLTMIVEKI